MKKKILSFILLPTIFLASCNLSSNQNEINIIYQDKSEESIDYDKGLKSSLQSKMKKLEHILVQLLNILIINIMV